MLVDIEPGESTTLIRFKLKDLTNHEDLINIASAIASGRYCFEAGSLLSLDFMRFMGELKPRITYGILVGLDSDNTPIVQWGKVQKRK